MERADRNPAYLWDMLNACRLLMRMAGTAGVDELWEDFRDRYAVERLLQIIGEAANRISPEFQKGNSQIPWSEIIGLRNVIVHDYDDLRFDDIEVTLSRDIPVLAQELERLLSTMEPPQ